MNFLRFQYTNDRAFSGGTHNTCIYKILRSLRTRRTRNGVDALLIGKTDNSNFFVFL